MSTATRPPAFAAGNRMLLAVLLLVFAASTSLAADPPTITRPMTVQPQASQPLTFTATPRVQAITSAPGAPGGQLLPQKAPAVPSSRERLLRALGMLKAVERPPGGSIPALPEPMSAVLTLEEAYSNGVTLTTTGCEYRGGRYRGDSKPMQWETWCGVVTEDGMSANRLRIYGVRETEDGRNRAGWRSELLRVWMQTPGATTDPRTYILELCIGSDPGEDPMRNLRINMNGEALAFTPTSDGTYLAIVTLPGTAAGASHELFFGVRPDSTHALFDFHWLNVVMR